MYDSFISAATSATTRMTATRNVFRSPLAALAWVCLFSSSVRGLAGDPTTKPEIEADLQRSPPSTQEQVSRTDIRVATSPASSSDSSTNSHPAQPVEQQQEDQDAGTPPPALPGQQQPPPKRGKILRRESNAATADVVVVAPAAVAAPARVSYSAIAEIDPNSELVSSSTSVVQVRAAGGTGEPGAIAAPGAAAAGGAGATAGGEDVLRQKFDKYDNDKSGHLDAEEFKKLLVETSGDYFRVIDKDGSGEIDYDEFNHWHTQVGHQEQKLKENFAKFDANKSERIDIKEFTSLLAATSDDYFDTIDADKSKQIDYKEFEDWHRRAGFGAAQEKADLKAKFDKYDEDKTGHLDKAEWKKLLVETSHDYLNVIDKDHSGHIDFEEFESWHKAAGVDEQGGAAELKQKFDQFDADKSNHMDKEEFKKLAEATSDDYFKLMDKDNSGHIDFEEFDEWHKKVGFTVSEESEQWYHKLPHWSFLMAGAVAAVAALVVLVKMEAGDGGGAAGREGMGSQPDPDVVGEV
ncbi:unnamed protein product [Amoebophrya sp. A120]|nr:unnamed protein product [Amoebophrya sp. A120]|eukprot:GSA120T00010842001.1